MTLTKLTDKQRAWLERYMANGFCAAEAAEYAGYAHPKQRGHDNVTKSYLRPLIEARMKELAMGADETLSRIALHAKSENEHVSLRALELLGKHHRLFTDRVEASSWRREVEKAGIPASELFEELIKTIHSRMKDAETGE